MDGRAGSSAQNSSAEPVRSGHLAVASLGMEPIQITTKWSVRKLLASAELCALIRLPQRTARECSRRDIGPQSRASTHPFSGLGA